MKIRTSTSALLAAVLLAPAATAQTTPTGQPIPAGVPAPGGVPITPVTPPVAAQPAGTVTVAPAAPPSIAPAQLQPGVAPPGGGVHLGAGAPGAAAAGQPGMKRWSQDKEKDVPVSATMQSLEARLAQMLSGKGGLTADDVAKRAEETSPEVRARLAALDAADANIDKTRDQFYPKVQATARYTRLSPITQPTISFTPPGYTGVYVPDAVANGLRNADGSVNVPAGQALAVFPPAGGASLFPVILDQFAITGGLSVPVSDYVLRLSRALGAAKQSRRAAELDERAARLKVGADARIAYYQWIRAQGQLLVTQQALEAANGHRADAQRAAAVGVLAQADVLRAEAQVKSSELLVARATNLFVMAEEQLRVSMHETTGKRWEIGENILTPLAPIGGADQIDALQKEALEKRLEVRSLDETEFSLREAAKLQRIGNYPRLDAQANLTIANPNQRYIPQSQDFKTTWDVSAVLSWTPSDIPATNAAAAETEAKASQIEAQKAQIKDALQLEVAQAYQAFREADVAIETTRAAVAASEESYRVRRDLFRNGRATSVELTDAETELTRARLEAVNARIDARVARVRLLHAVGRDVPPTRG